MKWKKESFSCVLCSALDVNGVSFWGRFLRLLWSDKSDKSNSTICLADWIGP